MAITLSPDTERLLDERVKAGAYASADDAVREALRLLERQEREHEQAFGELKAKLERGAAQAERGELADGEAFFDQLRARITGRSSEPGAA